MLTSPAIYVSIISERERKPKGERKEVRTMTIYVHNGNNEDIATVEVNNEKFTPIIDGTMAEGDWDYEELASELREIIEAQVDDPFEAYADRDCAEEYFSPILCW